MKQASFFREESAVAARQAKTDPLFLARTVKDAAESKLLRDDEIAAAHQILQKYLTVGWAIGPSEARRILWTARTGESPTLRANATASPATRTR